MAENVIDTKPRHILQLYKGKDKQWYWRVVAGNSQVVASGAEGYSSKGHLNRAVLRLKEKGVLAMDLAVKPGTVKGLYSKTLKKKAQKEQEAENGAQTESPPDTGSS